MMREQARRRREQRRCLPIGVLWGCKSFARRLVKKACVHEIRTAFDRYRVGSDKDEPLAFVSLPSALISVGRLPFGLEAPAPAVGTDVEHGCS